MRTWLRPLLAAILWSILLLAIIRRKRNGQWKRPHTFKWAVGLFILAIVLSLTGAVLSFYNL